MEEVNSWYSNLVQHQGQCMHFMHTNWNIFQTIGILYHCVASLSRMGYTRGIVVQNQYQGGGIGIVILVVKNHIYPIPDQYQRFKGNAKI